MLLALESFRAMVIENTFDAAHEAVADRLGEFGAVFVGLTEAVIGWWIRRAGFGVWIGVRIRVSSTRQGKRACDGEDKETAEED